MTENALLKQFRSAGWSVAVHNDHRIGGVPHTFWLLTHPSGKWVRGEGRTDHDALVQCRVAALQHALRDPPIPFAIEADGRGGVHLHFSDKSDAARFIQWLHVIRTGGM